MSSSSDSASALGSAYPPSQHNSEVLSAGSRFVRSWHDAKARVRSFIGTLSSDYATPRTVTKEFSILTGYFFMGWSDASAGALLPAIQRHYRLSYVAVSMLFVCNLVGWILAAVVTTPLVDRFTFGRCVTIFALVAVIPSAIIAPAPPFAVMAVSYVLYGLSIGAQEAMSNAWVSARPRAEVRLSCLHFLYGCGALCAPLAATPFVGRGVRFSFFYLIALGLASLNTIWVTYSFRFNREGYPVGQPEPADQDRGQAGENNAGEQTSEHSPSGARNTFRALLTQPSTSVLALFCLFYVGTEVTIGGWSSTFIIEIHGDAHSSSYLVSGFWAGLAAGRILLLPVNRLLGAHLATFVYVSDDARLAAARAFDIYTLVSLFRSANALGWYFLNRFSPTD